MRLLLIHGGLYEGMTPERFWNAPGVTAGLRALGHEVAAPARLASPLSWHEEADHLRGDIGSPSALVAGSNGCSAAVRVAIESPELVTQLVLCWPATCGDLEIDEAARGVMSAQGVPEDAIEALLGGEALRGCTDAEIRALAMPVSVIPSEPPNRSHAAATVEALQRLLPRSVRGAAFTETPRPGFAARREAFVAELDRLLISPPSAGASGEGDNAHVGK